MNFITESYVLNTGRISMERLSGECIIISFESGNFYSAVGTGADILTLLKNEVSQESWNNILSREYLNFDENNSGITEFLIGLKTNGIIISAPAHTKTEFELPADIKRENWIHPRLFIHDDLQGLMLVDPIHETSEEGWPKLKDEE